MTTFFSPGLVSQAVYACNGAASVRTRYDLPRATHWSDLVPRSNRTSGSALPKTCVGTPRAITPFARCEQKPRKQRYDTWPGAPIFTRIGEHRNYLSSGTLFRFMRWVDGCVPCLSPGFQSCFVGSVCSTYFFYVSVRRLNIHRLLMDSA